MLPCFREIHEYGILCTYKGRGTHLSNAAAACLQHATCYHSYLNAHNRFSLSVCHTALPHRTFTPHARNAPEQCSRRLPRLCRCVCRLGGREGSLRAEKDIPGNASP